jgi:hypothetical protein
MFKSSSSRWTRRLRGSARHNELAQPEPNYYAVGMKSYGRGPTFLMATGYEPVRSIAAALVGDFDAADDVQLDLPSTSVPAGHAGGHPPGRWLGRHDGAGLAHPHGWRPPCIVLAGSQATSVPAARRADRVGRAVTRLTPGRGALLNGRRQRA